jgi:hypothetical protein
MTTKKENGKKLEEKKGPFREGSAIEYAWTQLKAKIEEEEILKVLVSKFKLAEGNGKARIRIAKTKV